jgi:hypothetical protein
VALALVLLVASGLMIRTFLAMRNVQPGFTAPDEIFTMRIAIPETVVKDHLQAADTHEQIQRRIEAIPGVTSVAMASSMPMDGNTSHDPVWVEDKPAPEGQMPPLRRYKWVTPKFFGTIGTTLVAGRDFSWDDLHSQQPVVVISESLAREYWGSVPAALGRRIRNSPKNLWREVVGVVGDVYDDGVTKAAVPTVYWPTVMKDYWDQELFVQRWLGYAVGAARRGSPPRAPPPAAPPLVSSRTCSRRSGASIPTCRSPARGRWPRSTTNRWPRPRLPWSSSASRPQ